MSESLPLTGSAKKRTLSIKIDHIRCFGLLAGFLMLFFGHMVSKLFNQFPVTDEPRHSWWDILTGKKESNFHQNETYIHYLFHFIHTCVWIDNNPAKTVAAIFIQVAMMPLILFCILNYQRIQLQEGPQWESLKKRSFKVMVFEVMCLSYFFLCLVNSPIQDPELFDTYRAQRQFTLHYIPYMLFQAFLIVLSLEQVSFLSAQDKMPFPFMTKKVLHIYFYFMVALYIVYVLFLWTHIFFGPGHGLWDAGTPLGSFATNFIMYAFDVVGVGIPAICAFVDGNNLSPLVIEFSMGARPP
jgi:hypothetical protein